MFLNVNKSDLVKLTNKLERLKRSDMPLAVRSTLNNAAFDMKKNEIEKSFKSDFIIRKKSFIRSHTIYNKCANTFDVENMFSESGVIKGKSESGDDLINQEFGGTVKNREYVATKEARVSNTYKKAIRRKNLLKNIPKKRIKYQGKHFIIDAKKAGVGGFVYYKIFIYHITGIAATKIKAVPIYNIKKGRVIDIKKHPFLAPAMQQTSKKIDDFYVKNAKKRIEKSYYK